MDGEVPNLSDDEQGSESDGWDEIETIKEQTTCLFCPLQFRTIAVALDHCRMEHNFDLLELKTRFNMDCYSFIKMVNYIRQNKPDPLSLQKADVPVWNDDKYLRPVITESWLMYDFEDLGSTPTTPNNLIDTNRSIPNATCADLQSIIINLTNQLHEKSESLQRALDDIEKMKRLTKNLIDNNDIDVPKHCVGNIKLENDQGYFSIYSHFGIHHEMLSDRVRTESYRDAIIKNSDEFKDKVILDLGCGTGILSMFSAKAGAQMVWAVDQSEIVYRAMDIVRENNLHEIVKPIRGRLEDGQMPFDKVDIIVSEWMGYFMLFEGMLDSVVHARDKYLNPGGLLLPNRCTLSIIGSNDVKSHDNCIKFWKDVYGFKMTCMIQEVVHEATLDIVAQEYMITNPAQLVEIDLMKCNNDTVDFLSNFSLGVLKDGELVSLVGYFDTFFDLPNAVEFSTGPHAQPTHWKQTVFFLEDPVNVKKGEVITGTLSCRRHSRDARGLRITITLQGGRPMHYTLD